MDQDGFEPLSTYREYPPHEMDARAAEHARVPRVGRKRVDEHATFL